MLGAEAIGASEFLKKLDSEDVPHHARLARTAYVSLVNETFVYIFVSIIGFALLIILLPGESVVAALLGAPGVYFVWKLSSFLADYIDKLSDRLSPRIRDVETRSCLGHLLYSVLLLPWVLLKLMTFSIATTLRFGIDLPLRALSEYVVGPLVLRLLRKTEKLVRRESQWFFNRLAFKGFVFLFFGFFYQIIGTVVQLLK